MSPLQKLDTVVMTLLMEHAREGLPSPQAVVLPSELMTLFDNTLGIPSEAVEVSDRMFRGLVVLPGPHPAVIAVEQPE